MSATFEAEKNRKAFIYTGFICGAILLIALLVSWKNSPPPPKIADEFIEINLGNDIEGFGDVQPLIKGEKAPADETATAPQSTPVKNETAEEVKPDENTDAESAPVTKPIKTTPKVTTPAVVPTPTPPAPKPQKPKIAGYNGPKNGTGNGATEDNGYKYEGNKPGGKGDGGSPNGKPDSYGDKPGGRTGGGVQIIRTIIDEYSIIIIFLLVIYLLPKLMLLLKFLLQAKAPLYRLQKDRLVPILNTQVK